MTDEYPWRDELITVLREGTERFMHGGDQEDIEQLADAVITDWHDEHCDRNDLAIQAARRRPYLGGEGPESN